MVFLTPVFEDTKSVPVLISASRAVSCWFIASSSLIRRRATSSRTLLSIDSDGGKTVKGEPTLTTNMELQESPRIHRVVSFRYQVSLSVLSFVQVTVRCHVFSFFGVVDQLYDGGVVAMLAYQTKTIASPSPTSNVHRVTVRKVTTSHQKQLQGRTTTEKAR